MKNKKFSWAALKGGIIFFITIAVVVTVAVLVCTLVLDASGGNNTVVVFVMLAVILFLSAVCVIADYIRRKIMVERPVRKILEATDKIASGDYNVRIGTIHPYGRYD